MIFNQIYGSAEERRVLEIRTKDSHTVEKGTIKFVLKAYDNWTMRESPEIPVAMLFMIMDVIDTSLKVYGKQLEETLQRMKENQNGKED